MKQVIYIVFFAAIVDCARQKDSSEDQSRTSIERSDPGISIVPLIDTVVVSQDKHDVKGVLYTVRIKNQTGEKVFLVKPTMQIWKSDGKMELFKLFPSPHFDLRLFKMVDSLRGTGFMDIQKALALADQIISNIPPNSINGVDMQRRIFAKSILFLDPGEEKEIGMGIT